MNTDLSHLLELGDIDELLRHIDRLCGQRAWAELQSLREGCRGAADKNGKQLWGVAAHAEYRLALEADGPNAGVVLDAEPVQFALGPLSEVAASTHTWDELCPSIPEGPVLGVTAYERVVRGEDLSSRSELSAHAEMFELPLALQSWEPTYALAEYRTHEARFPFPNIVRSKDVECTPQVWSPIDDREATTALEQLASVWTEQSNGTISSIAVDGNVQQALTALDVQTSTMQQISFADALAVMAWVGASGGAHGRRAGAAAGRSKAWWTTACLAGINDEWPLDPNRLGTIGEGLQWWTWGPREFNQGWHFRLVIEDPVDSMSFAVHGSDQSSTG